MSLAEGVYLNKSLFCFEANTGATSSGVFAGDDPLKFYFPLLLYHICVVFVLSRTIHGHVLGRVGVPLVISQILVRTYTPYLSSARPCHCCARLSWRSVD
jgi:hypothetical protein